MRAIYTFSLLFLCPFLYSQDFAGSSIDNDFLCISEQASYITNDKVEGLSSNSGPLDKKYLITRGLGLREFGTDTPFLDECLYDDAGRPTFCEYSDGRWGGNFMMGSDNVFSLSGLLSDEDQSYYNYYWVIGRCASL